MSGDTAEKKSASQRGNRTLWLILAVCLAPFVISTALFYLAPPQSRMNYGELITPRTMPDLVLPGLDGVPIRLGELRGRWTMVQLDSSACDARCSDKLYKMRQVRLTQGKNMERVQRLWLVTDDGKVADGLLRDYDGTIIARLSGPAGTKLTLALTASESASSADHIWLIDPLGNIMLRYPPQADPTGMKKDLLRLLRVSRIE